MQQLLLVCVHPAAEEDGRILAADRKPEGPPPYGLMLAAVEPLLFEALLPVKHLACEAQEGGGVLGCSHLLNPAGPRCLLPGFDPR